MRFQITIMHKGQQIVMAVKRAAYFDLIVFQINANHIKAIIYQKDGKWQSTNDKLIDQELLDKIGAAIMDNVGVEQAN